MAYARQYIGKYWVGDASGLGGKPFVEGFSYMWHAANPSPQRPIPRRSSIASIMVSNKLWGPGNKYRHALALRILQSNLPIDIWGNGCHLLMTMTAARMPNFRQMTIIETKKTQPQHKDQGQITNDARIRGAFINVEPYDGYAFHVAIENYQSGHYMSEKILNPLIYGCTPIYLGSPHAEAYFPGMVIALTGDEDRDMSILAQICATPSTMRRSVDLDRVKHVMDLSREFL